MHSVAGAINRIDPDSLYWLVVAFAVAAVAAVLTGGGVRWRDLLLPVVAVGALTSAYLYRPAPVWGPEWTRVEVLNRNTDFWRWEQASASSFVQTKWEAMAFEAKRAGEWQTAEQLAHRVRMERAGMAAEVTR